LHYKHVITILTNAKCGNALEIIWSFGSFEINTTVLDDDSDKSFEQLPEMFNHRCSDF